MVQYMNHGSSGLRSGICFGVKEERVPCGQVIVHVVMKKIPLLIGGNWLERECDQYRRFRVFIYPSINQPCIFLLEKESGLVAGDNLCCRAAC